MKALKLRNLTLLASPEQPDNAMQKFMFGHVWSVKTDKAPKNIPETDIAKVVGELRQISDWLKFQYVAMDDVIDMLILATASGEPAFVGSKAGEAKTAIIKQLAKMLNGSFYTRTLNQTTHENDLIGGIDPIRYKNSGEWVRRWQNMAVSDFVFLDEIWKGTHAMNTILDAIAERSIEGKILPMLGIYSASNEIPTKQSDMAAWDRWTLRTMLTGITATSDFVAMLTAKADTAMPPKTAIEPDDLRLIGAYSEYLAQNPTDEMKAAMAELFTEFRDLWISPRRWRKLLKVATTNAILNSRMPTTSDLSVARWVLWNSADEQSDVQKRVLSLTDVFGNEYLNLQSVLEDLENKFPDIDNIPENEQAMLMVSYTKLQKELQNALAKAPKHYLERLTNMQNTTTDRIAMITNILMGH